MINLICIYSILYNVMHASLYYYYECMHVFMDSSTSEVVKRGIFVCVDACPNCSFRVSFYAVSLLRMQTLFALSLSFTLTTFLYICIPIILPFSLRTSLCFYLVKIVRVYNAIPYGKTFVSTYLTA